MEDDRLLVASAYGTASGQAALGAFIAIVVMLTAIGPALYFTWHAVCPRRLPEPAALP